MVEINYCHKLKKICEKCKSVIPYVVSFEGGTKFKCPVCKQFVNYHKCIISNTDSDVNLVIENK